ncbi:MAG: sirohydrochlorin cobaltochelatase [Desulfobacteraceae bacterium]|nr:sirohydrochlorin cobaltochelatase [Desulfobacteraceae bacterium]
MKTPIVLTAFGTTQKAFQTYEYMDEIIKQNFNDHPAIWAFTSRMVKAKRKEESNHTIKDPVEVLKELKKKGHEWAVVQSLHIIWGHEFQRLVTEALKLDIRISMGLPLLTSAQDYKETAEAVKELIPEPEDEAAVFVGHGTDHPSWTSYPVFENFLRDKYGKRIFTGVVEGYPGIEETIKKIKSRSFKKVTLIPFLLVAGLHFEKDLTQGNDSWQKRLESLGVKVNVVSHGLGNIEKINNIFARHIAEAFDAIP